MQLQMVFVAAVFRFVMVTQCLRSGPSKRKNGINGYVHWNGTGHVNVWEWAYIMRMCL